MPFLGKTPTKFLDANVNIDGGNIDGTTIGATSAASATVTTFTSTGIDDNATSTSLTVSDTGIDVTGDISLEETTASDSASISVINDVGTQLIMRGAGSSRTNPGCAVGMPQIVSLSGYDLYLSADGSNNTIFTTDRTERMRIDDSGNVGIGTSSPSSYGFFAVDRGAPASADRTIASFMAQSTRRMGLVWDDSQSTLGLANLTSQDLCFHIGGIGGANERMRIKSTGNVGIGTDNPESLLHIRGNATEGKLTLGRSGSNTTGNVLGVLQFRNEDGSSDGPNIVANIQAVVENTNGSGGYLTFGTHDGTEGGEGSSPVENMRITADGQLLVGTTSTSVGTTNFGTRMGGTSVPGYLASYRDVPGTGVAVLFGGNVGQVYVRGDGDLENTNNSYGAISDERLKSNIVDASSQIDDIMAVQVRSYTLNETGDTHIGVVAQELEASGMSGLVKTDEEGMKSVKYSILYMKAIKALQEAVTRIETLEAEVAALKGE
jgi:hypothetical protein